MRSNHHHIILTSSKNNYDNITLVQAAVGDKTGEIALCISDKLNVDHQTYETDEKREKINVLSYRLDDYLENKKIDFIKMDIQGFEYQALLGMKNTLQSNPDIKILVEFWPYGLIKAGSSVEKLLTFLHELDFQTELLEWNGRKKIPPIPKGNDFSYYRNLLAFR
jgi:FkbM family methyltransferase